MDEASVPVQRAETADVDPRKQNMTEAAARYMQGAAEPVTSSVLTSNSKYLNNPLYREYFAMHALRRNGEDLAPTCVIPLMVRALGEVTDMREVARDVEAEKAMTPEFAAWQAARRYASSDPSLMHSHPTGTLGAAIRDFLSGSGMEMEFIGKSEAPRNDIEHIVTGFGPNAAGEQALSILNVTAAARHFSPSLAQFINAPHAWVSSAGYKRNSLHDPRGAGHPDQLQLAPDLRPEQHPGLGRVGRRDQRGPETRHAAGRDLAGSRAREPGRRLLPGDVAAPRGGCHARQPVRRGAVRLPRQLQGRAGSAGEGVHASDALADWVVDNGIGSTLGYDMQKASMDDD